MRFPFVQLPPGRTCGALTLYFSGRVLCRVLCVGWAACRARSDVQVSRPTMMYLLLAIVVC